MKNQQEQKQRRRELRLKNEELEMESGKIKEIAINGGWEEQGCKDEEEERTVKEYSRDGN